MSSTVTNYSKNINVLYPIPGVDNDTQGFRDNFGNIKNALQAAAQELSNLNLNTSKLNTGTNDYNYGATIYRAPLKAVGYIAPVEDYVSTNTDISYLLGSYRKFTVNGDINFSVKDWPPNNIYTELYLELRSSSELTTSTVDFDIINLRKSASLDLPYTLPGTTYSGNPVVFKLWTSDNGTTVFIDKIIDTNTTLVPFMYDPAESETDVATAQFANSSTTATFATTVLGSTQTNITTLGTLTEVKLGSSTIRYSSPNLIISGISGLTIETTDTISKNLTDWSGGSGLLSTINTLTFTSVTGIDLGDTFKLWPSETSTHVVKSINTFTNQITTDPFNSTAAVASGSVGDGSSITFYKGLLYNSVYYASSAPTAAIGQSGDRRGAIFANSATIYVCYANYDGVNPIWSKVTTTAW